MKIKDEYYIKIQDFCKRVNIDVPGRNDTKALEEVIKRMKSIGLL
jgi:NifB/MoaA-like Fe-S oxidoreductase